MRTVTNFTNGGKSPCLAGVKRVLFVVGYKFFVCNGKEDGKSCFTVGCDKNSFTFLKKRLRL